MQAKPHLKIVLCSPRGFCAGVVRAIDTVERALTIYGAPVYVRHEIVHNRYVVDSLKTKGAIFVEELAEIPDNTNAPVVFSAHGVPKSVPADARARNFFSLDATCPLVTKVHREAAIHFKRGREILLIGHSHHPEVVGTLGQLPAGAVTLIETAEDAKTFTPKDPNNLAFVTQTTLSIDDTAEIVAMLKERFPEHLRPAQGRHLLRHHQPPARGQEGGAGGRRPDRGRRAELVEFAAPARSRRARGLPDRGAGAARRRSRLVAVRGHQEPRHHRGRLGAGSDRRGDHGRLRRALRTACGDGLGRGRERVLPAAAFAAARRRASRSPWRSTPTSPPTSLRNSSSAYDIGELLSYKGIAEGVENSNFLLHTTAGYFILTLYEKRVARSDLPFFLGLMAHLAARGIICPQPLKNRRGEALSELAGRPAVIINFLEGIWPRKPNAAHCAGVGAGAGEDASGGPRFSDDARQCAVGVGLASAVRSGRRARRRAAARLARLSSRAELDYLEGGVWPKNLPQGVIHADLFPDNVFFLGERVSGLIDFTFACNDMLAYDVAICLNAWCFESDCSFNVTKARALAQRLWPRARLVARPSRTRCRCWRAAPRCASC